MKRSKTPKARAEAGCRPPLKMPVEYYDTPELRRVSLEPDGILCLPFLGFDLFKRPLEFSTPHVHEECLDIRQKGKSP